MTTEMTTEISLVGTGINEVYFPPKSGENGNRVGFVWEGQVFRFATPQEILAAPEMHLVPNILAAYLIREQPNSRLNPCDTLECKYRGKERICSYPTGKGQSNEGLIQSNQQILCPIYQRPIMMVIDKKTTQC